MVYFGTDNDWVSYPQTYGFRDCGYKYKPDGYNREFLNDDFSIDEDSEYTYDQLIALIGSEANITATISNEVVTDLIYNIQVSQGGESNPSTQVTNPSYIDVLFAPEPDKAKILSSVYWDSIGTFLSSGEKQKRFNKTFSHIFLFNDYQATGYVELITNNRGGRFPNGVTKNTDGTWNFNDIQDFIVHNELGASGLTEETNPDFYDELKDVIRTTLFSSEAKIDLNGSLGSSSVTKPYYDKSKFKGLYFVVRLLIDNEENFKISCGNVGIYAQLL